MKKLKFNDLFAIGIGFTLGSAVFSLTGVAAMYTGGSTFLAYIIGAVAIEMAGQAAPGASKVNVNDILQRLAVHDVVIICNRKLTKIEADRIHYEDTRSGEEYILPMDYIVLSLGVRSNGKIHKELAAAGLNSLCVGDAATPSRIHEAILAGYNAAVSV